jgi:glycosyltransferase 2 family protein
VTNPSNPSKKNRLLDVFKWVWLVLVLAGGVYYVVRNYQQALDSLRSMHLAGLLLSVLFITISRLLNVDLIRESVKEVGWKPGWREMFSLVSLTQLGKYIPGGIWQFAARFGAYKSNNLTVKDMGKAFFLENVWVVLGGAMGGVFFLALGDGNSLLEHLGIQFSTPILITLAALSLVFWLAGIFIFQRFAHKTDSLSVSSKRTLRLFVSHFCMYLTMGVSFFFLFSSLGVDNLLFTIGAYVLSYLAGYVVIFAPGGIGVREVVSVFLFTGVAPQAELAVITIVHRLLYTVIEFLMGLIGFLMQQRQKATTTHPEQNSTPGE